MCLKNGWSTGGIPQAPQKPRSTADGFSVESSGSVDSRVSESLPGRYFSSADVARNADDLAPLTGAQQDGALNPDPGPSRLTFLISFPTLLPNGRPPDRVEWPNTFGARTRSHGSPIGAQSAGTERPAPGEADGNEVRKRRWEKTRSLVALMASDSHIVRP